MDRLRVDRETLRGAWTIVRLANLRHLREHPRRTLLALAGLTASTGLLIAISAINSTLNRSIEAETRGLAGDAAAEIAPAGAGSLSEVALATVRATPGVKDTVPFVQEFSRARHDGALTRFLVFGLAGNFTHLFPHELTETARELSAPAMRDGGLLLTGALAHSLGVSAGQRLAVETPHGYVRLRVQALLARGPLASVNGGQFALMTLGAAQRTFGRAGALDGIYVGARRGWSPAKLHDSLERTVAHRATVERPGGGAQAYQHTFDSIASISQESRTVGLVAALFLVLNTMSMALAERREELTLLLIGGASRVQVIGAFLAEAALLGVVGGILGVACGAELAHLLLQRAVDSYNILPFTSAGPLVVRAVDILLGLAGAVGVAVLGAALPAVRILRATPIDALRPEAAFEWHSGGVTRIARRLLPLGLLAIAISALVSWLAPLGSSVPLVGVALVTALGGAALVLPWLIPKLAAGVRRLLARPFFGQVGRLASDALLRAPGRTTIAAGGMAMAASFVLAVGTSVGSYRAETERAARAWYATPLYLSAEGSAAYVFDQPLPGSLATKLAAVPGVQAAYPMRFGLINRANHQLVVYALPVAQAARAGHRITGSLGISQRRLVAALGHGQVVISRLTARHHHLAVGDRLTLPTSFGNVKIRIGGVFDDIASFDSVFLEQSLYERLTRDSAADRFAIVVKPGADVATVKRRLERFVQANRIPGSVLTRAQMESYLVNSIQSLFSIAEGIQVAALVVAALIVLSTMLTATFERSREFGIQRILGMSRGQLGGSVVLEAGAIAAVGAVVATVIGLGLGFIMTSSIEDELAWRVSFSPSPWLALGTALITVLLGALAALYPSLLATRQTIVALLGDA